MWLRHGWDFFQCYTTFLFKMFHHQKFGRRFHGECGKKFMFPTNRATGYIAMCPGKLLCDQTLCWNGLTEKCPKIYWVSRVTFIKMAKSVFNLSNQLLMHWEVNTFDTQFSFLHASPLQGCHYQGVFMFVQVVPFQERAHILLLPRKALCTPVQ